jgi:hypothetical protein
MMVRGPANVKLTKNVVGKFLHFMGLFFVYFNQLLKKMFNFKYNQLPVWAGIAELA